MRQWFVCKRIECPPRTAVAISAAEDGKLDRALDRIITAALLLPLFVAPWFLGGLHPLGKCVLAGCALVALVGLVVLGWRRGASPAWTVTPIHGLLLAALAIVLLQMTPLPGGMLRWLSPSLEGLLPLWSGDEAAPWGRWTTISVAPAATRGGLAMLLIYAALFAVALERIRSVECVERTVRAVAAAAALLAFGCLGQRVFGDRHMLGFAEHPPRGGLCWPFSEPAHCLHFLALGVGPLACLTLAAIRAHREARRAVGPKAAREVATTGWRLWWRAWALGAVLVAAVLAGSAVGMAMIALAALVAAALLYRARLAGPRTLGTVGAILGTLMLASLIYQSALNADSAKLAGQSAPELQKPAPRAACCLSVDLATLREFWPLGAGAGAFDEVAPRYGEPSDHAGRPHAVNDYVRVALDTGLAGLGLLLAALAWSVLRCFRALRAPGVSPRVQACLAAVLAGLAVSATHATFDCVWNVPAAMAMTTLLVACAARLADFTLPSTARWRFETGRVLLAAGALVVVGAGAWTTRECAKVALAAPYWEAFNRAAVADLDTRACMPDHLVAEQLTTVLRYRPDDAQAHLQLASALLAKLPELSDGPFRERSIGWGLEHARAAIRLSPLAGEGYVYLSEFNRLGGERLPSAEALILQALRVRPHSSEVLLAAGAQRAAAGDLPAAVAFWREVFHRGPDEQNRLAPMLAAHRVPVEVILTEFQPDLDATRLLDASYTPSLPAAASRTLLEYYLRSAQAAARTVSADGAATLWVEIEGIYERLGMPEDALRCLRRAASGRPSDATLRTALGRRLLRDQEYSEAEMHFKWCLQRRPEDAQLQSLLEEAQRKLRWESSTAVTGRRTTR